MPGINNPLPGPGRPGMFHPQPHTYAFWLAFSTLKNLLLLPLFYLHVFWLLPKFLSAKRYAALVLVEVLTAALIFAWTQGASAIVFPGTNGGPNRYASVVAYLIVLSVAFGYHSYREAARIERLRKEQETESLKSELQFLRWQISPHFLFNALNNLVSLARKKSNLIEPMLINLSGLMRYMLYETSETVVTLRKEAQYLESYIRLQSIRYDNVLLETDINIPEAPDYYIEPMLLIPFVENAFKHGIDGIENPLIAISLQMTNSILHFSVNNRCAQTQAAPRDDASGVGLANVCKRLELLYKDRHTLHIKQTDRFEVSLKISLV